MELPMSSYTLESTELFEVINDVVTLKEEEALKILTLLRKFENPSLTPQRVKRPKGERIESSLFYHPKEKRYFYARVKIAPSGIKGAGLGVFALDDIPKGAQGFYKGVKKKERDANMEYSWKIEKDGKSIYIDASNPSLSNWTRYVNMASTEERNNMEVKIVSSQILYKAMRDIEVGEELFIDYGVEYRKNNLNMRYESDP